MEYVTLNNGVKMPVLGYGTYLTPCSQTEKLVSEAINAGYRHIDTAQNYGNEHEVGLAVKSFGLPREEFFITSKTQTSGYHATKRGIEKSLKEFGLDYIDLMIIHWPTGDDIGTYKALVDSYEEGLLRAVGVSNFNSRQLEQLSKNFDVVPAVDQIETHVLWQQKKMHRYLSEHGIVHEAWSPFGEGMDNIFKHPILMEIGRKYEKSAAQVILRFLLQSDVIVIPKSTRVERMKENLNVFDFVLSDEDMKRIESMDVKKSYSGWPASMQEY